MRLPLTLAVLFLAIAYVISITDGNLWGRESLIEERSAAP